MTSSIEKIFEKELDETPEYWFIGGLRYGKGEIKLDSEARINYPYTTYYTDRVLPFKRNGVHYIPLSEINLPLIVLQFDDKCLAARIEPVIETEEGPIHHFIGATSDGLEIVVPDKFEKKHKEAEWLGTGEKETVENPEVSGYKVEFQEFNNWDDAIKNELDQNIENPDLENIDISDSFEDAFNWLFRAWDEDQETFLQLPWRERPGFALDEYSYSLTANEATRLDYFDQLKERREEFSYWSNKLKNIFKNEAMQKRDLKHGEGMAWYNTSYFNGSSLEGDFYLGTGYYGYPGGQSTISYHLLNYLQRNEDKELEGLVEENLKYILSTQKDSGAWPAALKQEFEPPFKKNSYYGLVSEGATGESVKTLIKAWKHFGDEKYRKAARHGLEYLITETPICRNGLRDIGTNEVEAFSSFAVIEAFIEASTEFEDEKYLEQADTYCSYLVSWISLYESEELDLKGVCHPISETITQRISPYETVKAAKVLLKASEKLESSGWNNLAFKTLEKSLESVNQTGGMSEGIFYDFHRGLNNLETEQTFATSELLHTLHYFSKKSEEVQIEDRKIEKKGEEYKDIEINGSKILFGESTVFDLEKFGFSEIGDDSKDHELRFKGPYSTKSKLQSKLFGKLRKAKYSLSVKDFRYLWTGIKPGKQGESWENFSDIEKEIKASVKDGKVNFTVDTAVYTIDGEAVQRDSGDTSTLDISFEISTDMHDLICEKVMMNTEISPEDQVINTEDYSLSLENSEDSKKGFDISRKGNWTHAGIYRGHIELKLFQ